MPRLIETTRMDVEPIIRGVDAHKVYNSGAVKVHALRGVNLAIPRGEMVAIMGPSGCGKTTLLNCFSGLDDLTSGDVLIEGSETPSMRTSPDVRSSRPEKQFKSVVLPQPEGPMIATISPRGIARFTPRRAWTLTAPELYTLWASTPRIIGSTSMRVVSMSRGTFRVSLRVSFGARDEQVQRPVVLDAGRGCERLQAVCEFLVECLAAFRGHLAELPLVPSVRTREGDEFRHAREPDRERLRRRIPLLETCDAERLEDRTRVSECLRLRIRSDEPHRLPNLDEVLRRRSRPVPLEQFPQYGERRVRVGRPLAEHEPPGGFQDAVDLLEHAVVAERRDPEVADRRLEELAMVDDVPRVEHLEPDVPDARVPRSV